MAESVFFCFQPGKTEFSLYRSELAFIASTLVSENIIVLIFADVKRAIYLYYRPLQK